MVDRIRKVVENRSYLGPITLFLGAKTGLGEESEFRSQEPVEGSGL